MKNNVYIGNQNQIRPYKTHDSCTAARRPITPTFTQCSFVRVPLQHGTARPRADDVIRCRRSSGDGPLLCHTYFRVKRTRYVKHAVREMFTLRYIYSQGTRKDQNKIRSTLNNIVRSLNSSTIKECT
jgi:hypothetical protein